MSTSETGFDPFGRQLYAGNALREARSPRSLDVCDPATLERIGRIAECDSADIDPTLAGVRAAQVGWARSDAKTRAAVLHRVADAIERADPRPLCELMSREQGKPYPEAVGELANVAPVFRYYAELAREDAGRIAGPIQPDTFQYVVHEPRGVSLHVVPYNFPLLLFAWGAAASLAAGNGVVLKPSELTTLTSLAFMPHFAALPAGLVACLPGGGDTGATLVADSRIDVVHFTGSVAVGRRVHQACAAHGKPCVIEAGGSDAMIVTPSVPVEVSAAGAVMGAFHLTGQVCTSVERLIVVDAVYERFMAEFLRRTRALRIGPGLSRSEIGPLVTARQRDRVATLVEDAVAAGARLECGGRVPPGLDTGWFYEPTVLSGVTPHMEIARTEVFGPVVSVMRVNDLDEAIGAANASDFGLGASIFTTDTREAQRAVRELEAGQVWVNNPLVDNDALPFGGRKGSGLGRLLGREGLDAFRQPKFVTFDAEARVHDWWYPYPDEWFLDGGGRGS